MLAQISVAEQIADTVWKKIKQLIKGENFELNDKTSTGGVRG